MRVFTNCIFKEAVIAEEDTQFIGCTFESGSVAKQKNTFGLSINGAANVKVEHCIFKNKGYSAIYMNSTGKIEVLNNEIDCTGLYNPIEGGSGASTSQLVDVTISGNILKGICGNNYFNVYNVADNAVINIEDNVVYGMSQQAEVVRLSNIANHTATFNIKNITYSYDMSTAFDENWTKFLLCQDYTKDGIQDFTKYTVNISNITCNGSLVTDKDNFPIGGLICVYDSYKSADGESSFPVTNQPVINFN